MQENRLINNSKNKHNNNNNKDQNNKNNKNKLIQTIATKIQYKLNKVFNL